MKALVAGLIVFLGTHSIAIVAPYWRDRFVARIGPAAWRAMYSLVSLLGLLLVIHGFAAARAAPLIWYTPAAWTHGVVRVLMLPVFPLLLAAYFPGRIQAAAKHPMLAAVKLWAFAHLLANGTAAEVLLFGGFLAWAVVDRISLKRRPPRATLSLPASKWNDAIVVVVGLALYVLVVAWAHERLFGVSPLA
ncbi:MAG: NnrU family protein [Proteobacteria bacterium]|nr:NnrU family protein [Pseudomonadota bacterium]